MLIVFLAISYGLLIWRVGRDPDNLLMWTLLVVNMVMLLGECVRVSL